MILLLAFACFQDSKDIEKLLEEGRSCHRERSYEEAIAKFDEVLRLDPNHTQTYIQKGMALMGLGRRDEAAQCWDKALTIDPKLKAMIDELKAGRPPKRGDEDAELMQIEEKLRSPDLPADERDRLMRRAEEIRRRHHRREGPMGPEEVERVLEEMRPYLKENDPEVLRHIERILQERRYDEAGNMLRDARVRRREMEELKERDPEQYARLLKVRELERTAFELSEKIRRGGHETEDLRKKLVSTLEELFDLREELRTRELADLKRRVEELEKVLKQRRENKSKIVEKRLRQLLGERDPEDW